MDEIPFKGYMPFSKLLDYLHGEFDKNGDCWVSVNGVIQPGTDPNTVPENVAE